MGRKPNVLTQEFITDRVMMDMNCGCWIWTRACNPQGYGTFTIKDRTVPAHRAAYAVFKGDPTGLHVCHKCDNPPCCNPDHLFLGTAKDNQGDKARKGRSAKGATHGSKTRPDRVRKGEVHGMHILTEAQVVEIRLSTEGNAALGERYGVSAATIDYARNIGWTHVSVKPSTRTRRQVLGDKHPGAKLTEDDARAIRASRTTLMAEGAKYGVHYSLISQIRRRKAWAHVT